MLLWSGQHGAWIPASALDWQHLSPMHYKALQKLFNCVVLYLFRFPWSLVLVWISWGCNAYSCDNYLKWVIYTQTQLQFNMSLNKRTSFRVWFVFILNEWIYVYNLNFKKSKKKSWYNICLRLHIMRTHLLLQSGEMGSLALSALWCFREARSSEYPARGAGVISSIPWPIREKHWGSWALEMVKAINLRSWRSLSGEFWAKRWLRNCREL